MRTLLAAALLGGLTACSSADDIAKISDKVKAQDAKAAGALKVGDAAPAITAQKWLNGAEVKGFERDKVYVLDFWATWCGPCIQAMPHLAELAKEHKKAGLVVFPVTTVDGRNTLKQVEDFVAKRGAKFGFPFAVCETPVMDKAWFEASGQEGIPASFVVDRAGKIAFIGHPMELDDVLPMVLDGSWKGAESLKAIQAVQAELDAIQEKAEKDAPGALKDLDGFVTKYPKKAGAQGVVSTRLIALMLGKKLDEAKAYSETLVKQAVEKKGDTHLKLLGTMWGAKELNPDKKHLDLFGKIAEAMLVADAKDAVTTFTAAQLYVKAGDKARALELAKKSLTLTDDKELQDALQAEITKMEK